MKFTNYYIFKDALDAHGIECAAEHTCKLGFDSVEFLDFYSDDEPILPDRVDIDETRRTLDKYGLDVSCYSVGINILELGREKNVDILMKHAKAAAKLDSPFLHHTLVFPLTLPRVATLLRVLATRKGNTDEDDSGLARALGYVDYGEYL